MKLGTRKNSVTSQLKLTFNQLGIEYQNGTYSDNRLNGKAVRVKFKELQLNDEQISNVVIQMNLKGFKLVKINKNSYIDVPKYGKWQKIPSISFTFYRI